MVFKKIFPYLAVSVVGLVSSCSQQNMPSGPSGGVGPQDQAYFGYCYFAGDIKKKDYWMKQYERCHQFRPEQAPTCCAVNFGSWVATSENPEETAENLDEFVDEELDES